MPKMTVNFPHTVAVDVAREKVKPVLESTIQAFNGTDIEIDWNETDNSAAFNFKSMGFSIKGIGKVDSDNVMIEIDLPFAAMMFKDKAQRAVAKRLAEAFKDTDAS